MTDSYATERPTALSSFSRDWSDRPPAPIEIKPKSKPPVHALTHYQSALVKAPRKRPQIGAYTLDDLDVAFARCRYPTCDAPFLFCGAATEGESSWCACHKAIVFRA